MLADQNHILCGIPRRPLSFLNWYNSTIMQHKAAHTFHIPVMGLGFTIDTPVKVGPFGISSVISIVDDYLVEEMRKAYCKEFELPFVPIDKKSDDSRAKRITAYLNLVHSLVQDKTTSIRNQAFNPESDICRYFELLPENSDQKLAYLDMLATNDMCQKFIKQGNLRKYVVAGSIDVNIMAKVNKINYDKKGQAQEKEFADALAALRGYASSDLSSSIILSAGYNPMLYGYLEAFPDFFPNTAGKLKKKIILKVSDYRSAVTQGKILAKKGVWVSEFRIESGLNCGGHAFATDGLLIGPILEEFKSNRQALIAELFEMCQKALAEKGQNVFLEYPSMRVTVQGGIGTHEEDVVLQDHYQTQGTGWGSPFLLVPEATQVDPETRQAMALAVESDYYLSQASPLGIPFNNFRKSSSEKLRLERIAKGRPGSPCTLEYLATNTEFTEKPICTASRKYQHAKLKQLEEQSLPAAEYQKAFDAITEKVCLCTGLGTSALQNFDIQPAHHQHAVAICPGPNLAYFSGTFSLKEMVDHIYGRANILNTHQRPNLFVKELSLYVDYLKKEVEKSVESITTKQERYLKTFRDNLLSGVAYYQNLSLPTLQDMKNELAHWEAKIQSLTIPQVSIS